ncbi:MAG: lysophospholipid acyltransferase family protein [Desulfobaccales bacterium]
MPFPDIHKSMNGERRGLWLAYGLWLYFWLVLLTLILGIITLLITFLEPEGRLGRKIGRLWSLLLLRLIPIAITVEGLEHLVPGQTYVYAANHRSQFDIFVLLATLPGDFGWVAKKSLFQIPVFGQAMTRLGNISIDRDNLQEAIKSLNKAAELVKQGRSLIVFPEGTRATSRELLPFKKGVFVMALKAGKPIVPVSISGTMAIQPRGSLFIRPGPVKVVISPPIDPQAFQGRPKEELMAAVHRAIAEHFDPDYPHEPDKPRP